MRHHSILGHIARVALGVLGVAVLVQACGGSDDRKASSGSGGAGGSGGTGGSGGSSAAGGSATGGSTATGGTTGDGGTGGGSGGTTPDAGGTGGGGGASGSGGEGQAGAAGEDSGGQAGAGGAPIDPACETIAEDASVTAHLGITTDNECEVFVNGASVGVTANWASPVTIDVSLFVYPAIENVIAVRGTNTSSQEGNDRGIIGELTIDVDGGVEALVVTDASWRASTTEHVDWTSVAFDDAAWVAATEIANHGDAPWGALLTTTTAKWIWSAAVPASTLDKPNLETAYVRKAFYFGTDGELSAEPGCP